MQIVRVASTRPWFRIGILGLIVIVVLLALSFRKPDVAPMPVTLDVTSEQGISDITFGAVDGDEPLMCGCEDPTMSGRAWRGVVLPLASFKLGLDAKQHDPIGMFTQFETPEPGDSEAPYSQVPISITVLQTIGDQRYGYLKETVKKDRDGTLRGRGVHQISLMTDQRISVDAARNRPVSILDVQDGEHLNLHTSSGARPYESATISGQMRFSKDNQSYRHGADMQVASQVRVHVGVSSVTRLYIGTKRIQLKPRGTLELRLTSPFTAVRFTSLPVTSSQAADVETYTDARGRAIATGGEVALGGVQAPGVIPDSLIRPAKPFALKIEDGQTADAATWAKFYKTQFPNNGSISDFPSISKEREIDVYGKIAKLTSRSVVGTAATNGRTTSVARGSSFTLSSERGLSAGKYEPSYSFSAGSAEVHDVVSGTATVSVDGKHLTETPPSRWPVNVSVTLLGILGGVVVEKLIQSRAKDSAA